MCIPQDSSTELYSSLLICSNDVKAVSTSSPIIGLLVTNSTPPLFREPSSTTLKYFGTYPLFS